MDFPPYQAARKHPPMRPAFARSLSRKNATILSNSHDLPATLLIPSSNWSFSCVNQPLSDARDIRNIPTLRPHPLVCSQRNKRIKRSLCQKRVADQRFRGTFRPYPGPLFLAGAVGRFDAVFWPPVLQRRSLLRKWLKRSPP